MERRQGNLSIDSENIFPIIKKWLYSDQDIFLRELVSNGCDAITKLKKLDMIGETTLEDGFQGRIDVITDDKNKTLTIIDNGLGMTSDEVEEYINQIAFSGATDFINKYKDKTNEDQIIGHFGLGFYSAFMVADSVTIDSLSFKKDASPVHWECDGGTSFEMVEGNKDEVGTKITLHLNEDCLCYANEYKVREVLKKYCAFMPTKIFLKNENAEPEKDKDGNLVEEKPVNNPLPLWMKTPSECTDEEYKNFYRDVFFDYKEPLFWIHLNMDYPFNLKGILYFPKINTEYDSIEGVIKLYNNQVFIADNIKEVIPDFLMLLKGVIDCPDLPLNVSRSALQNDGFVTKISDYISKKVADKLIGLCKTDRDNYVKFWDDISPFIKYGCLKDEKFCEKMNDYILFKDLDYNYITLPDLLVKEEVKDAENGETVEAEVVNEEDKEKEKKTIYYVTDEVQQSQYINLFKANGTKAVILNHNIDTSFISQLERKNDDYKFMRIDSELVGEAVDENNEDNQESNEKITELFKKAVNKENLTVELANLKDDSISSILTMSEEERRLQDMMKAYGMATMGPGMPGQSEKLTLNANNSLVKYILESDNEDNKNMICEQLYDLALLANRPLSPEEMSRFLKRSNEIMLEVTKK